MTNNDLIEFVAAEVRDLKRRLDSVHRACRELSKEASPSRLDFDACDQRLELALAHLTIGKNGVAAISRDFMENLTTAIDLFMQEQAFRAGLFADIEF
jgi:two-component sensor histidine kinase